MVARSQFGHDAAVFRVHGNLGIKCVRAQAAVRVVQGNAGLIARCFNT
jgi:hypothetical protein